MGKRLTLNAWQIFKENYPDDVKDIITVDFPVNRYNIFIKRRRKKKKKKIANINVERYGKELGNLINWLDENINEQYHVEFDTNEKYTKDRIIKFYFMDETDAMAFKLMFEK